MIPAIKENKQRLWYLIFAVCLTVLLLYINFPSEALTDYIRAEAEKRYPDINIGFDKIGLTLSPGIKIRGLRISLKQDPDIPVYISEKSSVSVSILGWIKGDAKYYFKSKVKGGELSGSIEEKNDVKNGRIEASIDIKDIKLDENIFIHPAISQRIEGTLTGKIKLIGDLSDPLRGNTEIYLDLADGKVKFLKPFLGMDRVEYREINFSGVLDNRKLNIKDLNMTGGPVNGNATGTVQISNDFWSSRLSITAEIEPSPSLAQEMPGVEKAVNLMKNKMRDGRLPVDIRGTLERWSYNFR
ncbi:MAG: type II secretion system protein GspN [Desulfobacteraceae bacterium]|jgi:type II secretion system protein N